VLDLPMGQAKQKETHLEVLRFQGKRRALSAQSCELEAAAVGVRWSSSVDPTTVSVEVEQHSLTTVQGDLDDLCCSLPSMRFSKTDGAVFPSWVCAASLQHEAERIIPCHAAKLCSAVGSPGCSFTSSGALPCLMAYVWPGRCPAF
jgi:hypothetical protein